ncbi:hypothetical protein SAMN04487969_106220 [Paenibacillus algorifonticola]|uniref:Uncharacterized protein n=1 Tax=Paenibacillus algorifonticola TaxID=684063 RepID=A0A1I2DAH7_9BACL|nr:hypothetical protein SAMN04487969_106220 [Paenibacillus algorifonticola]
MCVLLGTKASLLTHAKKTEQLAETSCSVFKLLQVKSVLQMKSD